MAANAEEIEKKLDGEKQKWNEILKDLVQQIRHIDNVSEAQVLMLSYRHQLVDKKNELKNIVSRSKGQLWENRKGVYRNYKLNYDLKLNQSEINDFIQADLRDMMLRINLLENQLEYYQMTIDTLDKLGFAISNKITLATKF